MSNNRGKIVSFKDKADQEQLAVAYDNDQTNGFQMMKKVLVKHIHKTFHPVIKDGKQVTSLKSASDLTFIGLID